MLLTIVQNPFYVLPQLLKQFILFSLLIFVLFIRLLFFVIQMIA